MRYSLAFRNGVLRKVLPPENRSVYQVAREAGVSPTTIHSWMSKLKEGKLELTPEGTDPTPRDWPINQKFRLLMEGRRNRSTYALTFGLNQRVENPGVLPKLFDSMMTRLSVWMK